MAGVRGQSRGCGTCRARKIACGQERPSCAQCIKSQRQCTGYRRDTVFVLVQPGAKDARRPGRKQDTAVQSARPEQGPGYEMVINCHLRRQLLDHFLGQCLLHPQLRLKKHQKPWLLLLPDLPMKSKALETSMMAIASVALGRKFHDYSMVHQSLTAYTRGLRELQTALWSEKRMHDHETLAACLVLSLYELIECPDKGFQAYVSHCRGFLSLIQARGISAHTSGISHELFLGVRFPGILDAISNRTPNFLCDRVWCRNPWISTSKRIPDRIADCLAGIPSILQRYDQLASLSHEENISIAYDLRDECLAMDQSLQEAYEEIRLQSSGPLFWPVFPPTFSSNAPGGTSFPIVYHFPDLRIANMLMLYWSTKALLWSSISNLCDILESHGVRTTHAPAVVELLGDSPDDTCSQISSQPAVQIIAPRYDQENYLIMARNVFQSLEFCLQESIMLTGALVASTPITLATWAIRNRTHHGDREVTWISSVQEKMRYGLPLWQYI
ncbi:hypothetical protein ARAM_003494 [Aspergillus rambellii]|uniref:Zn(2)-C6 fungal-type domain-containing protein n=1 Tax=Aspergillus rambellii TaxID=308745 RepID=A0A0F8UIM6_9EURO|nr:hypothetical protein ARAM_003494 [Aspergillus rambellii]